VIIVAAHSSYDYDWIVAHTPLVVDTMNSTKGIRAHRDRVFRVGAPPPGQ